MKKSEYMKRWYQDHKEYLLSYAKKYRQTHKEKLRADNKKRYQEHKKNCPDCGRSIIYKSTYCRKCALKGERSHRFGKRYSTRPIPSEGYIRCRVNGKRMREHRIVAEKALGRPLKRNEIVHHINGDKRNTRNQNLLICTNSYHRWFEEKMALLYKQEHFGVGRTRSGMEKTS